MSHGNSYQPANYVPAEKPAKGTLKLQFGEMFQFPFSNPNWVMNVVMFALCALVAGVIPVLPHLVLLGYLSEMLEAMHCRTTKSYPDFDTNRLMPYLKRGIWLFLAHLVVSPVIVLLLMPIAMIAAFGTFAAITSLGEDYAFFTVLVAMAFFYITASILLAALNIFLIPLTLRAALCQDFATTFNFGWLRSFIGLMWKELILGSLALVVIGFGMYLLGIMLFCIGTLLTSGLSFLMFAHMVWQLYEIFLDRGGEPIPLKPQVA